MVDTVWALAYPIAYRDARTALTDQVILAASAAIADLDHRHDPHGVARHALQRLASLAIEATANPRPAVVPDPPSVVRARAATAAGPEGTDWIAAADLTWTTALRGGAVDAIATTAADIYTAWCSVTTGRSPASTDIRIGERDLTGWLRTTLGAGNRRIANQWLAATAARPDARTRGAGTTMRQPVAADRPGSRPGRAFPTLSTVDQAVAPADPAPPWRAVRAQCCAGRSSTTASIRPAVSARPPTLCPHAGPGAGNGSVSTSIE